MASVPAVAVRIMSRWILRTEKVGGDKVSCDKKSPGDEPGLCYIAGSRKCNFPASPERDPRASRGKASLLDYYHSFASILLTALESREIFLETVLL